MGHIVSCLHILKERIFVFMCILTYFFKSGLYFVFFYPHLNIPQNCFSQNLFSFFLYFLGGENCFLKLMLFIGFYLWSEFFNQPKHIKRAIKTMMENEVHLVFSRIQHVNPNFEDQYQIQEFEGDGQIWDFGGRRW